MYWFLALHCIGLYKRNGVTFLHYIVQLLPIPCLSHLISFLSSIDFTTMPASYPLDYAGLGVIPHGMSFACSGVYDDAYLGFVLLDLVYRILVYAFSRVCCYIT